MQTVSPHEKHYSTAAIAKSWGVAAKTVRKIFAAEPDVMRIGSGEQKRMRIVMRIPESVLQRVYLQMRRKGE